MEMNHEPATKALRILFCAAIVSVANSLIGFLPFIPAPVTAWTGKVILAVIVYCMFCLAGVNGRYRTSGIFRAVMLGCTLVSAVLPAASILTLTASVLSILAVYQEYHAHAELIAEKDAKLSGKWHSLFNWSIVCAVLVGFATTVTTVILAVVGVNVSRITSIVVAVLTIPQLILDVVYVTYLKKMNNILQTE